jgi:hypothetical protein
MLVASESLSPWSVIETSLKIKGLSRLPLLPRSRLQSFSTVLLFREISKIERRKSRANDQTHSEWQGGLVDCEYRTLLVPRASHQGDGAAGGGAVWLSKRFWPGQWQRGLGERSDCGDPLTIPALCLSLIDSTLSQSARGERK